MFKSYAIRKYQSVKFQKNKKLISFSVHTEREVLCTISTAIVVVVVFIFENENANFNSMWNKNRNDQIALKDKQLCKLFIQFNEI